MDVIELETVATRMTAPGKGILAADESSGTIAKRLSAVGVESTEETRRSYRDLLLTAPGLGESISGVILFDETIRQGSTAGLPFPAVLARSGVLPGIKVDRGTTALAGFSPEAVTEGLDGLAGRLEEYRGLGARFAKWRAVIRIGDGRPTAVAVRSNAEVLARYARECQEAGLVPIVEPEVLMDGDHPISRCEDVTGAVLDTVFAALAEHGVHLEGMVLKPNMVVPGADAPGTAAPAEVATATLRCLRRHVPAAVPGIAFLSGGQTEAEATANLDAMNRLGGAPWQLSFSFGRALQQSALSRWAGRPENVEAAQAALLTRARLNGLARLGGYDPSMEG